MLIKESTLRRIIREEAHRSLREAMTAPSDTPADVGNTQSQWQGMSQSFLNFVTSIAASASRLGDGVGASRLSAAAKSLTTHGSKSKFAKFAVNQPANVTSTPSGIEQNLGRLACVLASLTKDPVQDRPVTDWGSATLDLLDKTSQQDILSPILIKALGGDATKSTNMLSFINTFGATLVPGGVPAQAAPAVDPYAGTIFSIRATGRPTQVNVTKGRLTWRFTEQQVNSWLPTLMPIIRGQKVLQKGSKGADVKIVQEMIRIIQSQNGQGAASAMPGSALIPDGDYGNNTYNAVYAFQTATGLYGKDGKVGQQTLLQLFGRDSTMTGYTGIKGDYFSGLTSADGTTGPNRAGPTSPDRLIATTPTQNEGRIRRRY